MVPIPLSLEFSREYNFTALLYDNRAMLRLVNFDNPGANLSGSEGVKTSKLNELAAIASDTYISSLIKDVSLPDSAVEMEQVLTGTVLRILPKSIVLVPINLVLMEDSLGLVYSYFRKWQDLMFNNNTLTMSSFYQTTKGFMFSQTVDLPIGFGANTSDLAKLSTVLPSIPVNPTVYPFVFPAIVGRSDYKKSGDDFGYVKVTLARGTKVVLQNGDIL